MKNVYSILSLFMVLFSVSVYGQSEIYAPELKAPVDMAVNQMPDAVLDWDAVTGSSYDITYEAELATNPDFTDAVIFPQTDITAQATSNLLFGGTYYWHVRAFDGEEASEWSETWSFTVAWNVSMANPSEGKMVNANPEISWNQLTGITGYELQLDTLYAWSLQESGVTATINASYIIDNNMWAVGEGGLILLNDGTGWTTVESGITEDLLAITFVDVSNGYAVGNGGTVLYYDGASWTIIDAGTTVNLRGVSFADIDNGVVVGEGGAIVLYSAGVWETVTTGNTNNLYDVDMLSPTNIWACGLGKIIVNYDGTDWFANVVGIKDHYAITMLDANNGWTVGDQGTIYRWDGFLWHEELTGTSKDLFGVSFSGMNGYAVGASGTMLMYSGSWNLVTSGTSEDLQGVMVTADNGLVVGDEGVMIQKTDEGFNSPFLMTFDLIADTTSLGLSNLLFGQTFYYRMRAFHDLDTSAWSGVKSMTTYASPELESPEDASETDLLVKFMWFEYDGVSNYVFEIDTNENFAQPRSFAPDWDTLWVNDLVFGEEYYWRVAAQHELEISDWSEVWSISTVNTILLTSPENEADEINTCPLYTWEEVIGASEYELWVDIDASFSNPYIFHMDEPTFQCQSQMQKDTKYFWKVRGISGAVHSDWSDTWWFTTEGYIGIDEELNNDAVNIYPNPGNGEFSLSVQCSIANNYQLRVLDITGKLIYETEISCQVGENTIPVSLDNINNGAYNLVLSNGEKIVTKRLLIK